MSRGRRIILVLVLLIILLAIGTVAVIQYLGRRVTMNEVSAVGNSAGNIHNGGKFCENDGVVFFANPNDNDCLYSMNTDETGVKKLGVMPVRNIVAAGNFVYHITDYSGPGGNGAQGVAGMVNEYGLFRCRRDGEYLRNVLRVIPGAMQLGGSFLYFQEGDEATGVLNRIRIDGRDSAQVSTEHVHPACYNNGTIYYTGIARDHALHMLNTETGSAGILFNANIYQPQLFGNTFFFADAENEYRISRYDVGAGQVTALTDLSTDMFNVNESYIFFNSTTADQPGLYRMRPNGTGLQLIASGIFSEIHLTSTYVYVKQYGNDTVMYHMPIDGSMLTPFNPGI